MRGEQGNLGEEEEERQQMGAVYARAFCFEKLVKSSQDKQRKGRRLCQRDPQAVLTVLKSMVQPQ